MKNGSILKAIIMFIVAAGCIAAFFAIPSFIKWLWLAVSIPLIIAAIVQLSRRKDYRERIEDGLRGFKTMDKVDIAIDKEVKRALSDNNRVCNIIAENSQYIFYAFYPRKTSSNSKYYILRRSKTDLKDIVLLGEAYGKSCLFHDSIFYSSNSYIRALNIEDGEWKSYGWLEKEFEISPIIEGLDWKCTDQITNMYVHENALNCIIRREVSFAYDLASLNPGYRSFIEDRKNHPDIHYQYRQEYLDRIHKPDIDIAAVQRAFSSGSSFVEGRFRVTLNRSNSYYDAVVRDSKNSKTYNRRIEVEKASELEQVVEMYLVAFLCNLKQGKDNFETINLMGDTSGVVVVRNYDSDYRIVVTRGGKEFQVKYFFPKAEATKSDPTYSSSKTNSVPASKEVEVEKTTSQKKHAGLGRDESIIIKCEFESCPEDCPKDCDKCAIGIKTDGDTALAMGNFEEAIRQFKRAIFVEPRLSDAWCNLGNAYGMQSEYEKAIEAFDKAIEIDPKYGKALFGKAISLRNAGRLEDALALANKILEMYDDKQVEQFKNELISNGTREKKGTLSAQEAIDILTAKGMDIARTRKLLADDGRIHTIKALDMDESFASDVYRYCKKSLSSFGAAKVNSESVVMAFYGGIYSTLAYYEASDELTDVPVFAYLKDHVDLEKLEQAVETKLGIRGNETESEKVWNVIYPYARFTCDIAERVSPSSDAEKAVIDAADSAFILGMQLAMRRKE